MKDIGLKKCSNCINLKTEDNNCLLQPKSYYCPVLNNMMMLASTKKIRFKINKLDKFYCNFFENKNK